MPLQLDGEIWSTGVSRFLDRAPESRETSSRIFVRCFVQNTLEIHAMVDTAAEWSILKPELARSVNLPVVAYPKETLHTRFGRIEGVLQESVDIEIPADTGNSLRAPATFFIPDDWPGPNFIGWNGLLDHLRFAIDPKTNDFYFGRW